MFVSVQEYFFKDFFIIFAALCGLVVLIFIQLKNLGLRFKPQGRRLDDFNKIDPFLSNIELSNINFHLSSCFVSESFKILVEEANIIWYISIFNKFEIELENKSTKIKDYLWYNFSNSNLNTEKIINPIFRKIVHKYGKKFGSEKSIEFINEKILNCQLYSWLRNETHLHKVIFIFIEECFLIAKEVKLKPSLKFVFSDALCLEISMPYHETILLFEHDFKDLYAVDFVVEDNMIKIILWLAFSEKNIPETCFEGYSHFHIHSEEEKLAS